MMIFDLRTARLGDVLLAMPAMREGDTVIAHEPARVAALPVYWTTAGRGILPDPQEIHVTAGWLSATGRDAVIHELLPAVDKDEIIIAPTVRDPTRRWGGWEALRHAIPSALWVGADESRSEWMFALNRAHTVICPDTATMHMADALGCRRVVGLFGAALRRFSPFWAGPSRCIERLGMGMTPPEVLEAAIE